jgi:protocatechuate 3,4-dioxygenase beta subunit
MKKSFIFIAGLLLAGSLIAVNASNDNKVAKGDMNTTLLKGKVIDGNTGEGLPGVFVEISGTDKTAYTDFDGNFSVIGLQPGNYQLKTSLISYEKEVMNVDLDSKASDLQLLMENITE